MNLCVDIGNSRIKCAVVGPERVLSRGEVETSRHLDSVVVTDLVRRISTASLSVERAVVSSVVPAATRSVVIAIEKTLGVPPMIVDHKARFPFELAVPTPSLVGTDRLCAAAGAVGRRGRGAIVIDAGSATTVDLVHEGRFLGGAIIAGPGISLRALSGFASQLPTIDYDLVEEHFPDTFDTTAHAMILGASLACVGGVREAVRYLEEQAGVRPRKYLTGGNAAAVAPRLPSGWLLEPDLTLHGLSLLASLNRRRSDVRA